jgi:hypothetical protein
MKKWDDDARGRALAGCGKVCTDQESNTSGAKESAREPRVQN